ncbi:PAS domain-containing sensor histidine kinase [Sphingobacterium corticibacter]|uniref:histidine kinase n=1 Tax=Sphingobacterium corticibacter TaxID=2171749 RepID=A0A2T8HI37_9SPHI|nr:PAS domain-containing protein [Sphingobacterium corticibacter]PVH25108.1 PAS domain-containing sensor histidine kinase [Sphingobacterium corticibacter]
MKEEREPSQTVTPDWSTKDISPLFHAALDASVSGIIITDNNLPDNPIVYCNKSFERISGYDRKEIIGHNCRFLQRDDREQEMRKKLRDAVKEGKHANVEIRNYTKAGELFWNELYISPIVDDAGKVSHFIGVQNDVTDRKKAEQELHLQRELMEQKINERTASLRLSEEYLKSIVETVRESLLVLDSDLKVLTANEEFMRTFKVNRSETINKKLYDLGNGQWNIDALRELLEKILPTNNPVLDFEVEHNFPHIGQKLMLLNAHRIELEGTYKDRILLAIEDITDRRAIELRKDDFLAVASHELKTPLTTVKGYLQYATRLLPKDSDAKIIDIMDKANVQLDRLNRLIAELLDVSKIQSGNLEVHREAFDFNNMVEEAVESMSRTTDSHEIIFSGGIEGSYVGDEAQLSQVVKNLLANAVKYSPKARKIEVSLSVISKYIKFSVQDFGMGISLNDQKKIFERFYRARHIQQHFPGMGIGLYICEQIIEKHGGTLWVDSEVDKGSTFSFTLPINTEENSTA